MDIKYNTIDEYIKIIASQKGYNVVAKENAQNSYASEVIILTLENGEKIVAKKLKEISRAKNEKKYLNMLSNSKIINVPELIDNTYDEIVLTRFIEGKKLIDEEIDKYDDYYIIMLAKNLSNLHKFNNEEIYIENKKVKNEQKEWIDYIKNNIENTYNYFINNKGFISEEILEFTYFYLLSNLSIIENPEICYIHLDYRPGNVIVSRNMCKNNVNEKTRKEDLMIYTIDFESAKRGDRAFDLVKMLNVIKNKNKKELFLNTYMKNFVIEKDSKINYDQINYNRGNKHFYNERERIEYYRIYEAFLAIKWCLLRQREKSTFCIESYKILETLIMRKNNKKN